MSIRKSLFFSALIAVSTAAAVGAGRQLKGQHAPAATPALSPADAQKKFKVPDGFDVRLFAAEPDVVNPVAMTWDGRGRLWVLELYEYPLGAAVGTKPRDRVKILEDTDGDGRADKVTVFADGLNLATGLLLGDGGAYVGQAPELLFLKDANGDDVADARTVVMTGFGLEDRHELLNGFTWGPDGWLYMTHGVFTHSKVKRPEEPAGDGVTMNAAVARFHPRTKRFEVFADGTSNPWGVDFDREGNAFVSACVIDHLFHTAAGGLYVRQAGSPSHPYGYELLPSIVDHRHHMAAYAGVQVYQGDQFPEEYRGTILLGNIHDNSVHQDRLVPNGASFKASFIQDFVRANDGWFRPVSTQVGPDGAVWLMDWYDKYPCYQNANADPEGVDRERGRIWRVVYTGAERGKKVPPRPAGLDLEKAASSDLVILLAHRNAWQRRMAQRFLSERREAAAREPLLTLLRQGKELESRLAALWTLHGSEQLDETLLDSLKADPEPVIRAWVARLTGERPEWAESGASRLETLASDPNPSVRFAVAVAARQFVSGSLTVNTPPKTQGVVPTQAIANLVRASADGQDRLVSFMIWMASEPMVAAEPAGALEWMAENGMATMPLSRTLMAKTARRLSDTRKPELLDRVVEFVLELPESAAMLAIGALDGLIEGQKGKGILPGKPVSAFLEKLAGHPNKEVVSRAQQLGSMWGDAKALSAMLLKINDASASDADRVKALATARQLRNEASRDAVMELLRSGNSEALKVEAIRALAEIGGDQVGEFLIANWRSYPSAQRRAVSETLVSRSGWVGNLLAAIEQKTISAGDLPATVVRSLVQSRNDNVRNRALIAIGRVREANPGKMGVILEKRKVVLSGDIDRAAGREVAKRTCLVCHKLHGEGADIGPDLTGVGRSTLDALLANTIDPNQIIGKGYENVEVETKDGRTVSGRLVEDTQVRVRLLASGPKEEVVGRPDIVSLRVSELSVMPEGLEQMPDADFRNMIWYILNPPQDNRPMTPELRRELVGEENPGAEIRPAGDGESVALWNPSWKVQAPDFEGTPVKLPVYAGLKNVLVTHPADSKQTAWLERVADLGEASNFVIKVTVAAHEKGDWELRIVADDRVLLKRVVSPEGERWKHFQADLSEFAGKRVRLRLENAANGWEYEFGYWGAVELWDAGRVARSSLQK